MASNRGVDVQCIVDHCLVLLFTPIMQELEASLIAAKKQEQQEQLAKRDLEGEVRSHLAASTMLKRELDAV